MAVLPTGMIVDEFEFEGFGHDVSLTGWVGVVQNRGACVDNVQIIVHISLMDVISYTDTRERLKDVMDRVVENHEPVVISRQKAESVVMVSLADWHAIEETMHLLSSSSNARRLKSSIDELNAGSGTDRQLIEN
jgi:antitoxin YefM